MQYISLHWLLFLEWNRKVNFIFKKGDKRQQPTQCRCLNVYFLAVYFTLWKRHLQAINNSQIPKRTFKVLFRLFCRFSWYLLFSPFPRFTDKKNASHDRFAFQLCSDRLKPPFNSRAVTFADLVPSLRQTGVDVFLLQMRRQRDDLRAVLKDSSTGYFFLPCWDTKYSRALLTGGSLNIQKRWLLNP